MFAVSPPSAGVLVAAGVFVPAGALAALAAGVFVVPPASPELVPDVVPDDTSPPPVAGAVLSGVVDAGVVADGVFAAGAAVPPEPPASAGAFEVSGAT